MVIVSITLKLWIHLFLLAEALSQYTIGSVYSSRTVVSLLGMLTLQNKGVDLSVIINEGLLGLVQSVLK